MARKRGKKALYEVMSKARKKPGFGRTLEKMLPEKPVSKKEEIVEVAVKKRSATDVETSKTAAKWWRKPRVVQFNVGRIEFSMPYQLGVALVLGSVLLIVAAFRLGQIYYSTDSNPNEPVKNVNEIGKAMKNKRKTIQLTQRELAGLCNVGVRFISELENGKKTLEIEKVLKVAKNLGFDFYLKERQIVQ